MHRRAARRRVAGLVVVAALSLATGTAGAQPAGAPPGETPPLAPGWSSPAVDPQRYALLTPEERDLVAHGEISDEQRVAGGLAGTFFGFGLGHAIEGRFGERGWIFLVGEGASSAAVLNFVIRCLDRADGVSCDQSTGWLAAGIVGMAVFRVWEIVDVWAGPTAYNQRVRAARAKLYGVPRYGWFVAPTLGGGRGGHSGGLTGGVAGLSLRF